jgi:hypothetical protein
VDGPDGLDVVRVWTDDAEAAVLTITELIVHFEDSLAFCLKGLFSKYFRPAFIGSQIRLLRGFSD